MEPAAYDDLERPPLRASALHRALTGERGPWRRVQVLAETPSTQLVVLAAARAGEAEGLVVVAESQTAGRGRLAREWHAPPRAGLTWSVLLRPGPAVPRQAWGWLPLLAGVAVAAAVTRVSGVEARLKWPNDVLLGPSRGKGAGMLAEVAGDAVVLGVGLNVTNRRTELPAGLPWPGATSLALAGAVVPDRDPLLRAVLRELWSGYEQWRLAGGDAGQRLLSAYRGLCETVGQDVRVTLPGGRVETGRASAVDADGRLVVQTAAGPVVVAAGDVVHVRPG